MNSCSTAMQPLAHTSSIPDSNRSIPSKFRQKVTRYAPLAGICSAGIGQQTISAAVANGRFRIPAFFEQDLRASFPDPSEPSNSTSRWSPNIDKILIQSWQRWNGEDRGLAPGPFV